MSQFSSQRRPRSAAQHDDNNESSKSVLAFHIPILQRIMLFTPKVPIISCNINNTPQTQEELAAAAAAATRKKKNKATRSASAIADLARTTQEKNDRSALKRVSELAHVTAVWREVIFEHYGQPIWSQVRPGRLVKSHYVPTNLLGLDAIRRACSRGLAILARALLAAKYHVLSMVPILTPWESRAINGGLAVTDKEPVEEERFRFAELLTKAATSRSEATLELVLDEWKRQASVFATAKEAEERRKNGDDPDSRFLTKQNELLKSGQHEEGDADDDDDDDPAATTITDYSDFLTTRDFCSTINRCTLYTERQLMHALCQVCDRGHIPSAKILIAHGARIQPKKKPKTTDGDDNDDDDDTLTTNNNTRIKNTRQQQRAKVPFWSEDRTHLQDTPLHSAVRANKVEMAEFLLNLQQGEEKIDVDVRAGATSTYLFTPLLRALAAGKTNLNPDSEAVIDLLRIFNRGKPHREDGDDSTNEDANASSSSSSQQQRRHDQPLCHRHCDMVELLVRHGASLTQVDNGTNGFNALHFVAKFGCLRCAKTVVAAAIKQQHCCTIDCVDTKNRTPMLLAAESGEWDVCKFFIEQGANPSFPRVASADGSPNKNQKKHGSLLNNNSNNNNNNNTARDAMFFAIEARNVDMIKFLIRHGFDATLPQYELMRVDGGFEMLSTLQLAWCELGGRVVCQEVVDVLKTAFAGETI